MEIKNAAGLNSDPYKVPPVRIFIYFFQKTILLGFREENVSFIDFFGVFIELWFISTILAIPSYLKITR